MTGTIEYLGRTVHGFDPGVTIRCLNGAPEISRAFTWIETPQGDNFWNAEANNAGDYSKEARDAMIEMLYLWNEQHPNEAVAIPWVKPGCQQKRLCVGQRVRVVGAIGSNVREWIGMCGVVIQYDGHNDTVLPYEVKLENGRVGS